jgi:hypothetical protein
VGDLSSTSTTTTGTPSTRLGTSRTGSRTQTKLAAAHWLTDQARRGEVILPKSAQHVQETCQWPNAEERYLLALTILQLSGGWHMRDPLHIRSEELRCSMTSHYRRWPTKPPATITLEAVLHSARREPYRPSKDFPPDAAYFIS